MRDVPAKITASLKKNIIQYKHPWFKNKVVRIGVAKMSKPPKCDFSPKSKSCWIKLRTCTRRPRRACARKS